MQNTQKSYSQSLQANYNDRLQEIRDMRDEINLVIDKLENATLTEMDTLMNQPKDSLKADAYSCTKIPDELKQLSDISRMWKIRVAT
ncbi:hypothetical protein DPMN_088524 [Dreissena polymorpha]|uniref:Uncharacterized protein n=1 Tax=Dreissena polymorpha TaxID=45954 RepID=A0A9D4QXY7_DREPO|nr:hypothetical protein DPMN_088524 [Dreissena polymorpha]